MPELAVLVGALQPRLRTWFHPLHPVACILQRRPCLQGQGYMWIISSRSLLIRGPVFKVKVICRSYLKGHCCLEVKSSRSRLFVGHIFKVIVDQRSCLQGQGYFEVML